MPEIQPSAPEPDLRGGGAARCAGRQRRGGLWGGGGISGSVACAGAVLFSVLFLLVLLPFSSFSSPQSSLFTSFEIIQKVPTPQYGLECKYSPVSGIAVCGLMIHRGNIYIKALVWLSINLD